MNRKRFRLAIPALALLAASIAVPSSASVTLLGTPANQPGIPTRISACRAIVDGNVFSPRVEFVDSANPVREYIVTFAFFDKTNQPVTRFSVNETGPAQYPLPQGADNFTCAIERLTLEDGTILPSANHGGGGGGAVALGVLGAGAVIGLVAALGHSSSSGPAPTAPASSPSPSSSASASASSNPTSSPTPAGTPSPVPSATPSALATAMNTAIPTARPHLTGPRGNGR